MASRRMEVNYAEIHPILMKHGYTIQEEIGSGAQGVCMVVFCAKYQMQFVCKCMRIRENSNEDIVKKQFDREVYSLVHILHKNIVKIYDYFSEKDYLFMFIEYCTRGSLQATIKQRSMIPRFQNVYDYTIIRKFMIDILSALCYCHEEQHISHHDIKPQNIVIDVYGNAKLCDFGLSQLIQSNLSSTTGDFDDDCNTSHRQNVGGSLYFMSPQLFETTFNPEKHYNMYAADIWAFGITVFTLLSLKFPFTGYSRKDVYDSQVLMYEKSLCFKGGLLEAFTELPKDVPDDILKVLVRSLEFEEDKRATARELKNILENGAKKRELKMHKSHNTIPQFHSNSEDLGGLLFDKQEKPKEQNGKKVSIQAYIATKSLTTIKKKRLIFKPHIATP